MRINGLALVGLLFLDVVLFGFAVGLVAIIFSVWVVVATFIASPLLVVLADVMHLQAFALWRLILAALLAAVGFTAVRPFATFITRKVKEIFVGYWVFHQQTMYRKF